MKGLDIGADTPGGNLKKKQNKKTTSKTVVYKVASRGEQSVEFISLGSL